MTQATAALGMTLKRAGAVVPEVQTMNGVQVAPELPEVTAHDGPGWEEFVATILRSGEVSATVNLIPGNATHQALFSDAESRAEVAFTIGNDPTTPTILQTFNAFVTVVMPDQPVTQELRLELTLKPTGAVATTFP